MKSAGPETIVYRGRLIEIVHQQVMEASGEKTFEIARRGPGTRLIVFDRTRGILLAREYRHELGRDDIRLPGGKVFDTLAEYETVRSAGANLPELALEAASRELSEETGYTARKLQPLGISKCGATITWDLHYFLCREFSEPSDSFVPDPDEGISVSWVAVKEVAAMCLDGRISEDRSGMQILRCISQHLST